MNVGIWKEVKSGETRVAMTPQGVRKLLKTGQKNGIEHEVFIEKDAGKLSGYIDAEYWEAGARIVENAESVFENSKLLVHVKEPQREEIRFMRKEHILFTYLHLSAFPEITKQLMYKRLTAFAYETLEDKNGDLSLLAPMSKVAGKVAYIYSLYTQQKNLGGTGIYMGEIDGDSQGNVLIIGGGKVGRNAAESFLKNGANVTIADIDKEKREILKETYPLAHIIDSKEIKSFIPKQDVIIGAVLIAGAQAPKLLHENDLKMMKPGASIIDVSIDQGGITDFSRPTSIAEPTYEHEGKIFCCIPNIPGTVPRTSTKLLTQATLPYIINLANEGREIIKKNKSFQTALNLYDGKCTNKHVAESLKLDFHSPFFN